MRGTILLVAILSGLLSVALACTSSPSDNQNTQTNPTVSQATQLVPTLATGTVTTITPAHTATPIPTVAPTPTLAPTATLFPTGTPVPPTLTPTPTATPIPHPTVPPSEDGWSFTGNFSVTGDEAELAWTDGTLTLESSGQAFSVAAGSGRLPGWAFYGVYLDVATDAADTATHTLFVSRVLRGEDVLGKVQLASVRRVAGGAIQFEMLGAPWDARIPTPTPTPTLTAREAFLEKERERERERSRLIPAADERWTYTGNLRVIKHEDGGDTGIEWDVGTLTLDSSGRTFSVEAGSFSVPGGNLFQMAPGPFEIYFDTGSYRSSSADTRVFQVAEIWDSNALNGDHIVKIGKVDRDRLTVEFIMYGPPYDKNCNGRMC